MSERNPTEWLASKNRFSDTILNKKRAQTLSVISGKGGVGKTSVSLALCKTLSEKGHKVLLIDCDYNLSNAIIKLGLPIKNDFYDLLCGIKKFDECVSVWNGVHLLSGCNGSIDLFTSKLKLDLAIMDLISEVEYNYDYIILDCPAGLDRFSLALNSYTNKRIVVVNPDKSSITDAYSIIKILNKKYGVKENELLFNRVICSKKYRKMSNGLAGTISNFLDCRIGQLGYIPEITEKESGFDKLLNAGEKNSISEYLDKVVKNITEQGEVGRCENLKAPSSVSRGASIEQEVQPM